MGPILPHRPRVGNARWPKGDEQHPNTAIHRRASEKAERRVAGIAPDPEMGGRDTDRAKDTDAQKFTHQSGLFLMGDALFGEIRRPVYAASGQGTLVRDNPDRCADHLAQNFQLIHETARILGDIVHQTCVDLYMGRHDVALAFGHLFPFRPPPATAPASPGQRTRSALSGGHGARRIASQPASSWPLCLAIFYGLICGALMAKRRKNGLSG